MNTKDVISHLQIIATWGAVGKDPIFDGIEWNCCAHVEEWALDAINLIQELARKADELETMKAKLRKIVRELDT